MAWRVLLLFLLAQPSDRAFDLKGDTPGLTTIKDFKANHNHPDCSPETSGRITCRVYQDVSLAGVRAYIFKGCELPECLDQGITAEFLDGRLIRLRYSLAMGDESKIIDALAEKFGPATAGQGKWKNSVGYLSVSSTAVFDPASRRMVGSTTVVSGLNNTGESKDI